MVLGAGASCDFGFPTGEELVTYCEKDWQHELLKEVCYVYYPSSDDLVDEFHAALANAKPVSVDAWLEHNPPFVGVGKVAIAIALLYHEREDLKRGLRKKGAGEEPAGDWHQLLFNRLNSPFDKFQENRLRIITFNYDRSLEHDLYTIFKNTHRGRTEEECKETFRELEILHVYGSLGRLEWQPEDPPEDSNVLCLPYGADINLLRPDIEEFVHRAAESIKIIPEGQVELTEEFKQARDWVRWAKALYFLGFGYHRTNMERLGTECFQVPKLMGTGYRLGLGEKNYIRRESKDRLGHRILYEGNVAVPQTNLIDKPVYQFLFEHVDFNDPNLPLLPRFDRS